MKLKPIIKVVNFHALIRVDFSKKQAQMYREMEKEILKMIDLIINNKNFLLDKKIMNPKDDAKELNIYFGSDIGFCAYINTTILSAIEKDSKNNYKIVIGKKVSFNKSIDLSVSHEAIEKDKTQYKKVLDVIHAGLKNKSYSKINLIYNHYYNSSNIQLVKRCIYPLAKDLVSEKKYSGDFAVEGDIETILIDLLVTYLSYGFKIALKNANASENILRESSTSQALKKIDEKEEEDKKIERKGKNIKDSRKILDNFLKSKIKRGGQDER